MKKELSLLVLENKKPVKKLLAEINYEILDYTINAEMYDLYWNGIKTEIKDCFEIEELIEKYFLSINKIYNLFKSFSSVETTLPLYDKIWSVDITYAGLAAYNTKKTGDPDISDSIACYLLEEGIFQCLASRTIDQIESDTIHEFGHAICHLLDPLAYAKKDSVLHEVMAIFVEEKCAIDNSYGKPPHSTAKKILQHLTHTRFSLLDFQEQWNLINSISDHKNVSSIIARHLDNKVTLLK